MVCWFLLGLVFKVLCTFAHQLSFFTSLIIIIIILLLIKILPIYASTIPDSVRQLRMCGTNYNKLKYCMFTVHYSVLQLYYYIRDLWNTESISPRSFNTRMILPLIN